MIREAVTSARRVVVKVGSSSLTTASGGIDPTRLSRLVDVLAGVRRESDGDAIRAGRVEPVLLDITRPEHVEALAGRRRGVLRVNAVALLACAALLTAPAAGADLIPLGPGSQFDPSAIGPAFAYTQRDLGVSSVVVLPSAGGALQYPTAESPSLDGALLAYQDAAGIRIVRWATGEEVARVDHRAAVDHLLAWVASAESGVPIASLAEIGAAGHRVVHGAERFVNSVRIDDAVLAAEVFPASSAVKPMAGLLA